MMQKLVLIISALTITFAQNLISPCPSIFQYDAGGVVDDRWFGTITLKLDTDLAGIWLSLIFDRSFLELGTDFGEAVSRDTNKFLIRRPGHKVKAKEEIKIHIFAHFDAAQGIPQILGLKLNARAICPLNGIIPEPSSNAAIESPCPNLFTYDPFDATGGEWTGNIKVKSTEDLAGVWMRILLDKPPIQFATNFGEAVQREPNEYLVKYPNFKVKAGETINYRVNASYIPGENPPKLIGFRLNGRFVCPENGIIEQTAPEPPKIQIVSPCPNLFTYEPLSHDGNEWTGTIKVKTEKDLSGIWMRIVLDKPPIKFATNFGEAVQREPNEFLVKNPAHALKLGQTLEYKINASFIPGESPPKLVEFRLNAVTVCPEPPQANKPPAIPIATAIQPSQDLFVSPCPNVFNYEYKNIQSNRWYGNINYRSDEDYNGLQLQIVLNNEGVQLGNWFSEVTTDDNIIFFITRPKYLLSVGKQLKMRFFIKFESSEPLPVLKDILINEKSICLGEQQTDWVTFAPTSSVVDRPIFGPDFNPISRPNFGFPGEECGTVATIPLALISNGIDTEEAKWPWHAALYYQTASKNHDYYYCGGNLISLKHVLTVAHCTTIKHTVRPLEPKEIHVDLGKYLFTKSGRGMQHREVENIFVHPEYNPTYYPNDISILLLAKPVELTDWVRPVCLWSENNDINSIENQQGTVVGWGYNNFGRVTDKLLKAIMPIVSHKKCISSKEEFFSKFLSDRNFCAGFRNGTSVCIGDSGGGLVLPKSTSNPRNPVWQIRGLVSVSVATQAIINYYPDICDTANYVIFTDVAKHLDWIHQVINIK